MFNFRLITNVLGFLISIIGILMLLCVPISIYYRDGTSLSIIISSTATSTAGLGLWLLGRKRNNANSLSKKDGFLIVTLGWVLMSFFGSLPYLISGSIPAYTDAFFETISGFTTTGASVLNNIEAIPHSILFWRSMTQWIGGMGIIVMAVAILPFLGIGGMELFVAEAPGPSSDKLHPRIKETAKRLWAMYLILTVALMLLLMAGGMTFFDAINHAFTTMSTGGFSTHQASIAYFDSPFIQYTLIIFMFLAGTNFTVIYLGLNGKFGSLLKNDEFKTYLSTCLILTLIISFLIYCLPIDYEGIGKLIRDSLFQVVSILTTTGFVSADYTGWSPVITMLFFILMFIGGSAGSTSGGIKVVRHLILAKNCKLQFQRVLHPRAIIPVKLNNKTVQPDIISSVLVFVLIYLMIFVLGSLIMASIGLDFDTAIGAVATTLGNVGPGIGDVGPINSFSHIPPVGKWILSCFMLIGRLELFTVLVVFMPYYWKTY